jgi:MFS transporter, SP family, xylose:H+ symportor
VTSGQLRDHAETADGEPLHKAGYIWRIAFIAALGGLLFGYDWVVIGGAKHFYELYFHIHSEWLIGWANSCALLGCLVGSLVAGVLSDRFGRRSTLIASSVFFAVSSVLTGWAFSFASFIAWRITGGLAIGLASNVAPTYIAEVSPAAKRGRLVSLNQLTVVIGILLAQIANWLIADKIGQSNLAWNAAFGWRWMFTAVALPAVIFFALSLGLPESPRWLCMTGKAHLAERTLESIGGKSYALGEIAAILASNATVATTPSQRAAPLGGLFSSGARKLTIVACLLAVLQQWCGVNILFNYADEVYRAAGYNVSQVLFNIVITGAINLLATLVAMAFVDRFGRRRLMLFGCLGIGAAQLVAAFAYSRHITGIYILLVTLAAIACYAASLAPVTWVLLTELFPTQLRGKGVSLAASCLWIASFFVTYSFPPISHQFGLARTFLLYAIVCGCGAILVQFFVPETKGRSLEELGAVLAGPPALPDAP